jgi:hypothetical protein
MLKYIVLKCKQISVELYITLNFLPRQLLTQFSHVKLTFYGMLLKSMAGVVLKCKAADEI